MHIIYIKKQKFRTKNTIYEIKNSLNLINKKMENTEKKKSVNLKIKNLKLFILKNRERKRLSKIKESSGNCVIISKVLVVNNGSYQRRVKIGPKK